MDENCEYVQPRLALIERVRKFGIRDLYEPDLSRSKDKTVHLVEVWIGAKQEETRLRHETIDCITFSVKGKVEVHDPDRLESLNAKIASLSAHRMRMEAAIEKLSIDAPAFLCDLRKARNQAQETVLGAPKAINHQLGSELRHFGAGTVEEAQQRPRYLETKEKYEASAAAAKARLEELDPMITLVEAQLAAVL
jgi:hypothetical protein